MHSTNNDDPNRVQFAALFGQRLRDERERKGLSQTQFGALGGVARVAQANYEKGVRLPTVDYLDALLKVGVDIGYLLNGEHTFVRNAESAADIGLLEKSLLVAQRAVGDDVKGVSQKEIATVAAFVYGVFATMATPFDDAFVLDFGGAIAEQCLRQWREKSAQGDVH